MQRAVARLLELTASPDRDVADAALSAIVEHFMMGHIVVERPLSPADQQILRGLVDKVTGRSVQ